FLKYSCGTAALGCACFPDVNNPTTSSRTPCASRRTEGPCVWFCLPISERPTGELAFPISRCSLLFRSPDHRITRSRRSLRPGSVSSHGVARRTVLPRHPSKIPKDFRYPCFLHG